MMKTLISFTEDAISHISNVLKKHQKKSFFRLAVKQTGCSGYMYVLEIVHNKQPTDIEVDIQKNLIVLIDEACVPLIQGTTVDYVKKEMGLYQLTFDNPNAESLCGCGESFNLRNKGNE